MSSKLAFYGGTGGCAGFCLAAALQAGYKCTALARTPSKLTDSLVEKGVEAAIVKSNLTIVHGDVRDLAAVKQTLRDADIIISGIGGYPKLQWSLVSPVVAIDPTLCQDAGRTILQAAQEARREGGKLPLLISVSTTGIPPKGKPRDVPLLFVPLYHWLLKDPHADKQVQEDEARQHMQLPAREKGISGFVFVKASLLMDGDGRGIEAVRAGTDDVPAVGYTIQRKDVGEWMFRRLIQEEVRTEWRDASVTVTY